MHDVAVFDDIVATSSLHQSLVLGFHFGPGTDKGTTRAKPEIWQNQEDFKVKLTNMREALAGLQVAAGSGDKKIVAQAVGDAGKSCKACHDEYKAKNYLY